MINFSENMKTFKVVLRILCIIGSVRRKRIR